jgi:hypothetical protein
MSQIQFPKVDIQLTSDWEVEIEEFYQINPRYVTSEFCTPYLIEVKSPDLELIIQYLNLTIHKLNHMRAFIK